MSSSNLKKIDEAVKRIESAAKNGITVLNALTDNAYGDSPAVENPLQFIHNITRELKATRARLAENVEYEGMTEEEIAQAKEEAQKAAIEKLLAEAASALEALEAKRNPKPVQEAQEEGSEESQAPPAE
ncbi:MAG: hypothetical protein U0X91_20755 [Spirosomataceae bacterium]